MIVAKRVVLHCTSGDLDQRWRWKSNPMYREDGEFSQLPYNVEFNDLRNRIGKPAVQ